MSVTWTPEQLREHELKHRSQIQSAQSKPAIRDESLAEGKREAPRAPRIVVRIKSCRTRLLDPDNLCAKSIVDGLRYSGLIPGDRAQDIELAVCQEKCSKKDERTEITIEYQ